MKVWWQRLLGFALSARMLNTPKLSEIWCISDRKRVCFDGSLLIAAQPLLLYCCHMFTCTCMYCVNVGQRSVSVASLHSPKSFLTWCVFEIDDFDFKLTFQVFS